MLLLQNLWTQYFTLLSLSRVVLIQCLDSRVYPVQLQGISTLPSSASVHYPIRAQRCRYSVMFRLGALPCSASVLYNAWPWYLTLFRVGVLVFCDVWTHYFTLFWLGISELYQVLHWSFIMFAPGHLPWSCLVLSFGNNCYLTILCVPYYPKFWHCSLLHSGSAIQSVQL